MHVSMPNTSRVKWSGETEFSMPQIQSERMKCKSLPPANKGQFVNISSGWEVLNIMIIEFFPHGKRIDFALCVICGHQFECIFICQCVWVCAIW